MTDLAALKVSVDAKDVAGAANILDKLADTADRAGKMSKEATGATSEYGREVGKLSGVTQSAIAGAQQEARARLATNNATRDAAKSAVAAAQNSSQLHTATTQLAVAEARRSATLGQLSTLGKLQTTATRELSGATTIASGAQGVFAGAVAASTGKTTAKVGVVRTLGRVLGSLGGPIGIVANLLSIGATVWDLWGKKAEDAGNRAVTAIERARAAVAQYDEDRRLEDAGGNPLIASVNHLREERAVRMREYLAAKDNRNRAREYAAASGNGASLLRAGEVYEEKERLLRENTRETREVTKRLQDQVARGGRLPKPPKPEPPSGLGGGGYLGVRIDLGKGISPEPPRDTTAERTAEVDRMLAQAKQEELQSQLALTKDIGERSRLQREIAKGDADAAQKELAAEYKRVQTDEGLTQAGKDELGAKLLAAAFAKARVARDQDRAIVDEEIAARSQETLETERANYQNTLDVLESEKGVAQTASERHRIDMEILRVKHEQERLELRRVVDQGQILGLGKEEIERAKKRLAALDKIQANETKAAETSVTLAEAYEALSSAVSAMVGAFNSHDWVGVFKGLNNAIKSVTDAYKAGAANGGGRFGGTVGAVGAIAGAIAPLVGGRAGSALSGLAAGVQIGSMIGGPVGAVVGGIIGTIGGALAGGKRPTNAGALATFNASGTAFSLSGDKRTSETSGMATSAGNAILQGQQFLQASGIKLAATVTSIDIGVRDMTDIILSDGRALTSAVGDPAAAAETALKALLEGATYASDAQKQLVESMLAAGKGFDDISAAIQTFNQTLQASREFGTNVADEILRLTNPQGYDVEMLRRAQEARRAELDSYLAGGFIDQAAFDKLVQQLQQLNGLELAEVMGRYSDSVKDATTSLVEGLTAQLAVVSSSLNDWTTIKNKLLDFQKSLTSGDLSGASGKQSLAMARQAFEKVAARVAAKDRGALDELPGAGKAYIDALKASARTPEELARGLNRVKSVVGDATTFAGLRQDEAITQLNNINSSILAVRDAILAESAAANTVPGFANGGSFTVGGAGGVDSQLVMFKATPGEVVDIHNGRTPQNLGLMIAANSNGNAVEIAALRADINGLRADNQALMRRVAEATEKTNITLRRVTRDGDSLVTTAA